MMEAFEWRRLFIGEDQPWFFLLEVAFRTLVMYSILLLFFKITGKKGIKQLTVFDLILIIGLGSAAGDPMFISDSPLLPALVVFVVILLVYLGLNRLTQKSHKIDVILEGETSRLFRDGRIDMKELVEEGLTTLQLFSELRQRSISHLGQIDRLYLEFSGEVSIYYRPEEDVVPGLPLYPELLAEAEEMVREKGFHSCVQCGFTRRFNEPTAACICPQCQCTKVVKSIDEKRIC